jgi:hypothetical protein
MKVGTGRENKILNNTEARIRKKPYEKQTKKRRQQTREGQGAEK